MRMKQWVTRLRKWKGTAAAAARSWMKTTISGIAANARVRSIARLKNIASMWSYGPNCLAEIYREDGRFG